MGVRKRQMADRLKEERRHIAFAKLTNVPSSPRKMRLVADMVRGMEVHKALGVLQFSNKNAAYDLLKCLKSCVANWEAKNETKAADGMLYISTIYVNPAPMLKRLRPAPQGRAYRIRKRANHVYMVVDKIENKTKKK